MADEPAWRRPADRHAFEDGTPKVLIGELHGLRSFAVTPDGWLTGVIFPKPWAPGVNKSECWSITAWEADGMRTEENPRHATLHNGDAGWEFQNDSGERWTTRTHPTPMFENQDDPKHSPANCTDCGLHGYLRGSLSYGVKPHRISGVVRAWGQMALGDRGFRAQYARILALYLPGSRSDHGGGFQYSADEPNARPPAPEVLDKVRDRYHLPIYRTLTELTDAYPTTPPPTEAPS